MLVYEAEIKQVLLKATSCRNESENKRASPPETFVSTYKNKQRREFERRE